MVRSVCWVTQVAYEASEPSDRPDRPCLRSYAGRAGDKATHAGGVFPPVRRADLVRAMPSDLHFAPLNVQGLDSVSPSGRMANGGTHTLPASRAATACLPRITTMKREPFYGAIGMAPPPCGGRVLPVRTSDLMPTVNSIDALCSSCGGLLGHAGSPALKPGRWVPIGRQRWSP